jgi:ActR/RegA family two-component response regulator
MSDAETTVFVVEDDPSYRRAIARLIGTVGHRVVAFGSAPEFLHSTRPDAPACLVLDVRLVWSKNCYALLRPHWGTSPPSSEGQKPDGISPLLCVHGGPNQ